MLKKIIKTRNIKHIASIISPYNKGEKTLLAVLSNLKEEKKVNPIPVFFNALKHLAPALKVLPQIRAGKTIFLSASITERSSLYYAMRWCLNRDNVNLKTPLHKRLTTDLLDAFQKTGHAYAFKKELNQSVINSRVNAKHSRRKFERKGRKGRRIKLAQFRKLKRLLKRRKKRDLSKLSIPVIVGKRRRLSKRYKFKFLRKAKKKPSLEFLTDFIPASIKSSFQNRLLRHYAKKEQKNKKKNRFEQPQSSYKVLSLKKAAVKISYADKNSAINSSYKLRQPNKKNQNRVISDDVRAITKVPQQRKINYERKSNFNR